MFIQTEATPNPLTWKFIPGQVVLEEGTLHIANRQQAQISPLAERLFSIAGIQAIFLGADFISVTKIANIDWDIIRPDILDIIMDHYINNRDMIQEDTCQPINQDETDPLIKQIKEIIDTRVRPSVAQDGGDIIFHSFKDGVVKLELQGACSGCPSSVVTLKNGIENLLKYYVPEVESVEAVD